MRSIKTKDDPSLSESGCNDTAHNTKIGTCGFGLAKAAYARAFACVEIQHTFYQPPQLATLERWRAEMPADFEFTLKAWQLITHDARSPTYRRLKKKLSETERQQAGYFRATDIVEEAWSTTLASARALRARTILFQCPASFRQTKENIANLEKFFSSLERQDLNLCWEPRGAWDSEAVSSICAGLDLWHVVDPLVSRTTTPDKCYFRLHGKHGWRYQYETAELEELAVALPKEKDCYVFFNNSKMTEDALKLCQLLA
ncbi:MAG TPA: DUF72 domain-containing protein [Pyrinomonadaceae bacterium]|nr:DUF72 domain-containing protein [Pyrinomonadaceae bacterium]